MNSYGVLAWEYVLIERLINSSYANIELVVLNENEDIKRSFFKKIKDNRKQIIFFLYNKLEQKLFKLKLDAFEKMDATGLLHGIRMMKVKPISTKFSDRFRNEDIVKIRHYNLDLLIRFGFRILRGDILNLAKYGIWSYHHGDNMVNRGWPAGFWEVMNKWSITGSTLQILTEDLDAGKILYRSYSQTDRRSIYRNRNNIYWKSLSFLPRKLEELYSLGAKKFFRKVQEQNKYPNFYSNRLFRSKDLQNKKMIGLITVHLFRQIVDIFVNLIFMDQWILLFNIKKGLSTSFWRFRKIVPPKDRFFADPFIIQNKDKYYIFIEEFIYKSNKAHISVIEMDKKGNFKKPVTVLEKSYHLSYPFIFKNDNEYFLIPESRSNKSIELYKCVEFPFKWEFQMNLMEKIEAVDVTLFYYQKKWWLFANIVENPGASALDELFLFFSERLLTKNWTSHPLNPVVSDARKARPAGKIFIHNGKIIRPSQNNSKRYGFGLKMNEIKVLNENCYEEIEVESIEPNWDKQIIATHTFNRVGNLTMTDGMMRRRRIW